jgi:hypothetical protein
MTKQAGVWIDHRRAVIVILTDEGQETRLVISKSERQLRRSGDSPLKGPFEPQLVPQDDRRERTFVKQLSVYYDAVIAWIRDAESILIFGPGEAKGELKAHLERDNLGGRIVGLETADKMTDRQITAKVRQRFRG